MKIIFVLVGSLLMLGLSILPSAAADFSAVIQDADGKPMAKCSENTPACAVPTTLGDVASAALFATFPDENDARNPLSAAEKVKRAALALRIRSAGNVDMTAEETALIKSVVGKAYSPIIVYRAWALLDPASVK